MAWLMQLMPWATCTHSIELNNHKHLRLDKKPPNKTNLRMLFTTWQLSCENAYKLQLLNCSKKTEQFSLPGMPNPRLALYRIGPIQCRKHLSEGPVKL